MTSTVNLKIARTVYKCINNVLDSIFPPVCKLCGSAGEGGIDICSYCLAALPRINNPCRQCGIPLSVDDLICGACVRRSPPYHRVVAPFLYGWPSNALVASLKYRGHLANGQLMGTLLAQRIAADTETLPELLIPIPLHRRRLRGRGFNQAAEIARPLRRRFGVPINNRVLIRTRADTPQTQLSGRDRRRNTRGAFRIRAPLPARHIALVDDVMTTGSTVEEATRVLRRAGAERIEVWVFARAF